MHFLLSILPALIVLGILIIIHELGHFLACRLTGVRVEKFSIGFGPEIFHWQGKETRYAISIFPLGGFVKPAGETVSELGEKGFQKGDYLAAPLPARMLIVSSGVLMNYILAFFLFAGLFMAGRPMPASVVGGFVENYPAASSGKMKIGDRIVSVDGNPVKGWESLMKELDRSSGAEIQLMIQREAAVVPVSLKPRTEDTKDIFGQTARVRRIGIMPDPKSIEMERYGFFRSFQAAWELEVFLTVMTHKALFYLATGRLSAKTISGPIGIISMTGTAAQMGLRSVLHLMAMLSVSLAVINFLPFPALDGGHLLFLLIEAVRRKRISLEFQERATQAGFAVLIALMVVILYNDLVNIQFIDKLRTLVRF